MEITSLYSKKVLEHFRKPKNMGVIKNPDAEATVGNPICGDVMRLYLKIKNQKSKIKNDEIVEDIKFQTLGCFPSTEEVSLDDGKWREIGDLSSGSNVLNSDGEEAFVAKTLKRQYAGSLLTIVPFVSPLNSFSATPDHPILCVKRNCLKKTRKSSFKCSWLRIDEKELLSISPDYVKARELTKGDYLVFPVNQRIEDNKLFTPELMRLLGYYLSEGYITANGVTNFAFNRKERKLIKEVKELVFNITGKEISERTRREVTEVRFCSKRWADFLYAMAGKMARKKALCLAVLLLPYEKQREMVETYMLGDGNTYRRRHLDSETHRFVTASKDLAVQVQGILARGGIFASIRKILKTDCVIDGRKLKDSVQYLASFKLERKHKFVHRPGNYFLVPIRRIEKNDFRGLVYNLQVALEPNSYLVRGFAVHNCGAAIATSSVLTEMAKGKTLEEAEKITNKDIVDQLGGLPLAKLHCSVLAADALKKAIRAYREKKNP